MATATDIDQPLALLGGPKAVEHEEENLFHWPIVTSEDEQAVIDVLRAGTMSSSDIALKFEEEWAAYNGTKYALSYPNGTMSLMAAMWAAGLRRGDEMICPSLTYWGSTMQILQIGATVVFADVDPVTVCIDPNDIERHITPRTKAIMVVHYCGHPCDMDAILPIARKHRLKVIEDVSHAHGALYKGRMVGTFGDVSAMSMMSGKSLAIGEGGMLVTDDLSIYEHAIAFSHYERHHMITEPALKPFGGLPLGGVKGRLNQTCAAMGRVQLRHYPQRMQEIQHAVNRFWDLLEGTPGIAPHRTTDPDSTMGGWYCALGHYRPEELGGLSVKRFAEAVAAEGSPTHPIGNFALHRHPVMNDVDIFGDGQPTRIAFSQRDLRQGEGALPVAEGMGARAFHIPWFKHDRPDSIARHAAAFRKVATQADKL